ncbi:ABC transporter ATP-binding protein [Bradyrhizobium diazoefficiens]|uniref:ABC transporter ATP-binding protein n=1 Tax=Bradyrhizobium diazoefficiens TaxID=1355477 RepID=UPI00190B17DD|nr:ABC transporter ATP-binding protein [Bradyrhizobium diazoefficiens]QQO13874.1 ABC transporter ATP-binding protein [Bradyrhizobium diazoefficiens]
MDREVIPRAFAPATETSSARSILLGAEAPPPNSKLKIEQLEKHYGNVQALAPTSLEVRAGEFLTLLGPSGSGKTTLLMAIAGLVQPDRGRIWIDGQDSTSRAVHDRDIGMVFQNYALFPHLDVFENVAFSLRVRGVSEAQIRQRAQYALALVQLDHLIRRFPKELSGGQQQRVAIARSLVYEPSIILMDEPLGALDKRLREQMQAEIRRIHRQLAVTVIYVTHDQEEALSMSDRICLMNGGSIEQIGRPEELYFSPSTLFAAKFLGEANILAARRTSHDKSVMVAGTMIELAELPDGVPESLSVLIRPESFLLEAPHTPANCIEGRLVDITMLGPLTRLDLVCDDDTSLVAKLPTRRKLATLEPGQRINLFFAREDAIIVSEAR